MTDDATRALRGRRAVAAMFLVNGFLIGSWAPQIPVTLARLEITEFTLKCDQLFLQVVETLSGGVIGFLIQSLSLDL